MDHFEHKIDQDATNLKKVRFTTLLAGQKAFEEALIRFVTKFAGIEHLDLPVPGANERYLTIAELSDNQIVQLATEDGETLWASHRARLGEQGLAIVKASPRLASGRVFFQVQAGRGSDKALRFAPSNTVDTSIWRDLLPRGWYYARGEILMPKIVDGKMVAMRKRANASKVSD